MKISELQDLIRAEIHRVVEDLDSPATTGPSSELSGLPGSPFGTTVYSRGMTTLPNEAREMLKLWVAYSKWALKKYGAPNEWPERIRKGAELLGNKFQESAGRTVGPVLQKPGSDPSSTAL